MICNDLIKFFDKKTALEIGGPSQWMSFVYPYLESIVYFNNEESMTAYPYDYTNTNISFGDLALEEDLLHFKNKFDLCFSSHVLEHVANPIKALKNLKTVLVANGTLMTIVPNKNLCWDRQRVYTTFDHLLNDFYTNTPENDLTHIEESACMIETRPTYYRDVGNSNEKRIIHHHTFSIDTLKQIHEFCGFKTVFCNLIDDYQLHTLYIGQNE